MRLLERRQHAKQKHARSRKVYSIGLSGAPVPGVDAGYASTPMQFRCTATDKQNETFVNGDSVTTRCILRVAMYDLEWGK